MKTIIKHSLTFNMIDDYFNSTKDDDQCTYNVNNHGNTSKNKPWIHNDTNNIKNENDDDYEFDQTAN